MSRSDRRQWAAPQTVTALGEPMARWLEGAIRSWPGYAPNHGPEPETAHLVPSLAALNRAGFLTTCSQPGLAGTGVDGLWWEQRAAAEGYIADRPLYHRLLAAADDAGLTVVINDPGTRTYETPEIVTTCDGEPVTAFGHLLGYRDMRVQWRGVSPAAFLDLAGAVSLAIIAPEYGTAGERLWPVLDLVTGLRADAPGCPWSPAPRQTARGGSRG
ncbi:hypothetical protein OG711_39020 (plasmid) [Streptomyces uncialis]|uniref:DUF6919 domain-containing protein n=1 Tax=Streptomyces uncialis TaxID=1048205 RepID=UPI002E2F391F|nr:hypothetical protein [Streptomyces uncialis]WTE16035.1 hypothetical protein OG924_37495 [Streptomyces uncialis]